MEERLEAKLEGLLARLGSLGGVLVAYSGGTDSAFLAAAASRALGDRAVAATAVSPSLAREELKSARETARLIGIRHELIETRELDNPEYAKNPANRCYFCKSELFKELRPLAERLGLPHVAYGAIVDDRSDFRPGASAAKEAGALAPLDEAELGKAEIRELSKRWGLPTWDKPSSPCLSSRLPHGLEVTPARLSQVERAERYLRSLGLKEFRVRHHDRTARIELRPEDMPVLLEPGPRKGAVEALKALGFDWVTLDLAGFKSGGMNPHRRS